MTIREFSEKYNIDRTFVYNATVHCTCIDNFYTNRQYAEQDLLAAVRKEIMKRVDKHRTAMEKAENMLRVLNNHEKLYKGKAG